MKLSKKMAVALSAALVAGGAAAVVAPSAQALPTTALTLACDVAGISTSAATWNASHTISLNGSTGIPAIQMAAGSTVNYTYTYTNGPNNGGPAVVGRARAAIQVATAATGGTVIGSFNSPWSADVAVAGGGAFPGAALSGTFTAPTAGNYFFRVNNVLFEGYLGSGGVGTLPSGVLGAAVSCNDWVDGPGVYGNPDFDNPTSAPVPFGGTAFQALGALATVASINGQVAGVTNYARANNTLVITGSDWFPSSTPALSATVGGAAAVSALSTDGSGNLTGTITVPAGATVGVGSVVVTQGALSNTITPFNILGTPSITITPASSSPAASYPVGVTGSNFDPLKGTTYLACGTNSPVAPIFCTGVDNVPAGSSNHGSLAPIPASGTGTISGSVTIVGTGGFLAGPLDTNGRLLIQVAQGSGPSAVTASLPFDIFADRCIAWNNNVTAGSCQTVQNVSISVLQGRLTQRAYTTATPTASGTGVIDSTATTPVQGTRNFNTSATEVNLGSLITPLIPTDVFGTLNDVTVSDNRGGTNGWSLVADVTDPDGVGAKLDEFNGLNGNEIAANNLFATANCVETDGTGANQAWDYNNAGQVALAGYDYSLNAPVGTGSPAGEQQFPAAGVGPANTVPGGAITLCTKSANVVDAVTQSTGGVYTVGADLRLRVPAFQAADKYAAVITITLS